MYQFRIEGFIEEPEIINKIRALIDGNGGCRIGWETIEEFGDWLGKLPEGPIKDFGWQCNEWANEYEKTSGLVDIHFAIRDAIDDAEYSNEPDVIADQVFEKLISEGNDSFEVNKLVQSMIEECIKKCREGDEE